MFHKPRHHARANNVHEPIRKKRLWDDEMRIKSDLRRFS